jgi:hypothetical protein
VDGIFMGRVHSHCCFRALNKILSKLKRCRQL